MNTIMDIAKYWVPSIHGTPTDTIIFFACGDATRERAALLPVYKQLGITRAVFIDIKDFHVEPVDGVDIVKMSSLSATNDTFDVEQWNVGAVVSINFQLASQKDRDEIIFDPLGDQRHKLEAKMERATFVGMLYRCDKTVPFLYTMHYIVGYIVATCWEMAQQHLIDVLKTMSEVESKLKARFEEDPTEREYIDSDTLFRTFMEFLAGKMGATALDNAPKEWREFAQHVKDDYLFTLPTPFTGTSNQWTRRE